MTRIHGCAVRVRLRAITLLAAAPLSATALAALGGSQPGQPAPPSPHLSGTDGSDTMDPPPEIASYEAIDRALDGRWLMPDGTPWRYFIGDAHPGVDEEELAAAQGKRARAMFQAWTKEEFDDSTWAEGPSPFLNGLEHEGTVIEEMGASVTTVYLRAKLEVSDVEHYERIVMEIPVDDGFTFYFNGSETKRRGAGDPLVLPGPAFTASTERSFDTRPVPASDLTRTIESGVNQLAIHAYVHADDKETFIIAPRIWADFRRTPALDAQRYNTLAELFDSSGIPREDPRRQYLDARHAQRNGDAKTAAQRFAQLMAIDPQSALLWDRQIEVHRELGGLEELEAGLRSQLASGSGALVDAWTRVCLDELKRTPAFVAGALPEELPLPADHRLEDVRWIAQQLGGGMPLRIDSGEARGAMDDRGALPWSHDRFFAPSSVARRAASDATTPRTAGAGRSIRVAERSLDDTAPLYDIPLPEGAYELRLTFVGNDGEPCEAGDAVFDVVVEGAVVLADYDPVVEAGRHGVDRHSFPVWVDDGSLALDLRRKSELIPWLAGLEITRYDDAAYLEHARARVDNDEEPPTAAWVELGRAHLRSGDPLRALEALEHAEQRPDFLPGHARLASTLRKALLPRVASFETADDLARNHADLCQARMSEILDAAGDDPTFAIYLGGRIEQNAGRCEEALGAFEELIGMGTQAAEPYLRMAECLVRAELPEHAIDILAEGRGSGVSPTPEWIALWISLNLRTLGRDTWSVIEELESFDPPAELVVVPTSEHAPQLWHMSVAEPPSTSWCRTTFDASPWPLVEGVIGAGRPVNANTRGLWNTDSTYAQRRFELPGAGLLYPHLILNADGALNTYINGTAVGFVGVSTEGYLTMPARKATWMPGDNVIGVHAFNQTGEGAADAGVVQPLADLLWVSRQLREHGVVRLNCGGDELTTADGTVWGADRFYGWGPEVDTAELDSRDVSGTVNDELYRTMRGFHSDIISTWYQIPLPNGNYVVRTHFAELEPGTGEGDRTFLVSLEKKRVLENYDIVARVGFGAADVHEFETTVSDGWLDLRLADFDHVSVISAIEIEATP